MKNFVTARNTQHTNRNTEDVRTVNNSPFVLQVVLAIVAFACAVLANPYGPEPNGYRQGHAVYVIGSIYHSRSEDPRTIVVKQDDPGSYASATPAHKSASPTAEQSFADSRKETRFADSREQPSSAEHRAEPSSPEHKEEASSAELRAEPSSGEHGADRSSGKHRAQLSSVKHRAQPSSGKHRAQPSSGKHTA